MSIVDTSGHVPRKAVEISTISCCYNSHPRTHARTHTHACARKQTHAWILAPYSIVIKINERFDLSAGYQS